jgi:protein-L-isoaspartate O-methyltransferase
MPCPSCVLRLWEIVEIRGINGTSPGTRHHPPCLCEANLGAAQVDDPCLELPFAQVRREDFLGPGPWVIPRWLGGNLPTPSADPVYLYIDSVVQIMAERQLNNGQPSGHAKWIASASIKQGEHVVHVGTGTGYYTAIMSHLAGPTGKVTGIELDADLAARAKENLSSFANVRIVNGNGAAVPFEAADVIYVNAGVTRPAVALDVTSLSPQESAARIEHHLEMVRESLKPTDSRHLQLR